MTGQMLPFDPATHKIADALLPWFVNGTLESDELDLVRKHVGECSQCQREVEWLRELHAACAAAEQLPEAANGARELRRKLSAPRDGRGGALASSSRSRLGARWAVAAALFLSVAVATVWTTSGEGPSVYRTLGARDTATVARGALVVVFDPGTTEFDLRRMLRAAGARIVDGPTQTNAYVLSVPSAAQERALQALRSERGVILAERLDSGPAK